MSPVPADPFYTGTFEHSLDAKGRVTVPRSWRFEGDELESYLAWWDQKGYINVYPPRMTQKLRDLVDSIGPGNQKGQALLRRLLGNSHRFGCDKVGRIKLPDPLLEKAGLSKEAVLVGVGGYFSVYSPERYRQEQEEDFDFDAAMAELLG